MEQRTSQQNKALHVYFELVADALNSAGFDIQKTIEKSPIDISWSRESVKELLWRPIQKTIYSKQSTTELEKSKEIDAVYENLNRFLARVTHFWRIFSEVSLVFFFRRVRFIYLTIHYL